MKIRHDLPVLMAKKNINNLSQLSRITGIQYSTLNNFYNYKHKKVDSELLLKLCEFFGCKLSDLVEIHENVDGEGFPKNKKIS